MEGVAVIVEEVELAAEELGRRREREVYIERWS